MEASEIFDASQVEAELAAARRAARTMLNDALSSLREGGALYYDDLPYLGFIERAQAFHLGVISLVEQGNPLGAVTLLRAYAENAAVAFWIDKRPQDLDKLRPGATHGLPIGRVIAEAERQLPGFKALYSLWSDHAHPSGSGGFHTLRISADGQFTWQSHPNFKSADDARQVLDWLESICTLTTQVISHTGKNRM
ncbi:hypothetical protein [Nocardia farcinica]|uniref:hypothetical protein n=1 Tax=Nocardia farcinica TaxID=37329 RepID=UPI002456AC21|nr:hypothetical protein [Nocardia farcinica]